MYRIFLKAPISCPFQAGKTYTVAVDPFVVVLSNSLTCALRFPGAHCALHVNQVAYPTGGPKIAYLSWLVLVESDWTVVLIFHYIPVLHHQ